VTDYRGALETAGITTKGKSADELKEDAKILQEAQTNLEKINKELSLLKDERKYNRLTHPLNNETKKVSRRKKVN